MSSETLDVQDLTIAYGSRVAVEELSVRVDADECVALIGANGAGKSSSINAVVGITKALRGTIQYGNTPLRGLTPRQIARLGITLCPEGRHLFPQMSVHDNLLLGASAVKSTKRDNLRLIGEMEERFPVLGERRKQLAGTLSGGEQQMVAIARALMARPNLLILDEPSLGLSPRLTEQVLDIARTVVQEGCSVLISEQNVEATLGMCDRAYVLEAGRLTYEGTAVDLKQNRKVLSAFLGLEDELATP